MTRRLLIGRALSALATALIPTTLTLAVLRATGSAEDLGLVLACELLPLLLCLPVAGVVADRLPPARVVLVADLVRCLAQAGIGIELLAGVGRIADLAVLSAVTGVAIAFGMPAVPRLVVAVVPPDARLRVNARIGVATSLSSVLAPALAGGVVLAAGPGWSALLTAAVFACSALTLGGIRTSSDLKAGGVGSAPAPGGVGSVPARGGVGSAPAPGGVGSVPARGGVGSAPAPGGMASSPALDDARTGSTSATDGVRTGSAPAAGGVRTGSGSRAGGRGGRGAFGRELAEGWREVRARRWFVAAVLGHGVWHFVAGLFLTLGPLTAVNALGGEASWVLIVQCGTVGLVLGVLVAPRLPVRRPLVAAQAGAALYVLPLVALAVPLPAWGIAGAYLVAMFGLGVLSPLWETLLAEEIPEAALGRVRSFDGLISFASRPLGLAVAAPLAGVTGMPGLLVAGAVLVAVANLAAVVRFPAARPLAARRR
ncbi:MFS transporter [Nonomuraea sp. NPDC049725]|uniref:MFS transporter n=1 Tax=Nonomuraea sp. NPDC049725 TaxID=3154508 RepID=UPI0034125245